MVIQKIYLLAKNKNPNPNPKHKMEYIKPSYAIMECA
jgi:hypothetical protein